MTSKRPIRQLKSSNILEVEYKIVMTQDGVNVLWCRLHLVWLVFEGSIPTCTCFPLENFFETCILGENLGNTLVTGSDIDIKCASIV